MGKETVHVPVVMEKHSRGECVTHLLASVRGPEKARSLRRPPRSGCVVETAWTVSRSHGLLGS